MTMTLVYLAQQQFATIKHNVLSLHISGTNKYHFDSGGQIEDITDI